MLPPEDPHLAPALLLTYGAVDGSASVPIDSFPGGTCFFADQDHVFTAAHVGEMVREEFRRASMRMSGGLQPYRMHVFDPRLQAVWRVEREIPIGVLDASILKVKFDASLYVGQSKAGEVLRQFATAYPVIRMSKPVIGEILQVRGFSNVELEVYQQGAPNTIRRDRVSARGVVGNGAFRMTEVEGTSSTFRSEIIGFSALGLNSGSPVLDSEDRLVGIVSKSLEGGDAASEPYTGITLFSDLELKGPRLLSGRHMTRVSIDQGLMFLNLDWG